MYVFFGILFLTLFYFFILLPNAVKRHVKDAQQIKASYNDELNNLRYCIDKAETVNNLNMCWHAVIEFHIRNKFKGLKATKDAKKLYTTIRHKIKTINN